AGRLMNRQVVLPQPRGDVRPDRPTAGGQPTYTGSGRRPGTDQSNQPRRQVRTLAGGLEQVRPLKVPTHRDCNPTGWAGPSSAAPSKARRGTVGRGPAKLPYPPDLSE